MSFTIRAGRRDVAISRPDKELFPGISKRDLARYYEGIAPAMLPHVRDRPLNLERYPDGIDGHRIIQQHASGHFPAWVRRIEVPARRGTVEHVAADDAAALVYLAGQAAITLHRWLARRDRLDRPDLFVVDLDPSVEAPAEVRAAARSIGALLRELGLTPWVMTTGSRGYHVVVALARRAGFDAVRDFSRAFAALAAGREPERFTTEQRKAKREGKILLDVMRNAYGHTSVAPYSVRPRAGGPVATPLHWEALEDAATTADRWTVATVPERLAADGDPWAELSRHAETLGTARRRLDEALAELAP